MLEKIINKVRDVHEIALLSDCAKGIDGNQINVRILGENLDNVYLSQLANAAGELLKRHVKLHIKPLEIFKEKIIN